MIDSGAIQLWGGEDGLARGEISGNCMGFAPPQDLLIGYEDGEVVAYQADARTGRTRVADRSLPGSKVIGAPSVSWWNHASRTSLRRNV
jgi:hypothetical protein